MEGSIQYKPRAHLQLQTSSIFVGALQVRIAPRTADVVAAGAAEAGEDEHGGDGGVGEAYVLEEEPREGPKGHLRSSHF
jgi:hypothetical protein